jgi:glucose/mannose-6-phosphate isomerase
MKILDDPDLLKKRDPGGMLKTTYGLAEQIEDALSLLQKSPPLPSFSFQKMVFCGTGGGSRSAFDLIHSYLFSSLSLPFYPLQAYELPGFVDADTLAVLVSHSGNTEETVSALENALYRTRNIVVVTGGGEMENMAHKHDLYMLKVPVGIEARSAIGYLFFVLLHILGKLFPTLYPEEEIEEAICHLKRERELIREDQPLKVNLAKQIASKLEKRFPMIYGFAGFSDGVALRFQRQLAENAKMLAHSNLIPNMHHDEIVGYEEKGLEGKAIVVLIRDHFEEKKISKRFEVTKEVLEEKGFPVLEVYPQNKGSKLARMFSLVQLIDYASIYLALLRGFNPREVFIIKLLKQKMRE